MGSVLDQDNTEQTVAEPGMTGDTSGIDVDQLLSQVESGQEIKQEPAQAAAPAAPTYPTEVELKVDGKVVKAPWEKAIQWASMGHNYSQRMAALKAEQEGWESQKTKFQTELESKYSPYKLIDEYSKQDPEWWAHVEQAYQEKLSGKGQATGSPDIESLARSIEAKLEEKFKPITEKFTKIEQAEQAERIKEEDATLDAEIKSIRDQYSNLDWNKADENGHTLEQRIVKHAIDNGISKFRAAFADYCHSDLLKFHEERGKQSQISDIQRKAKQGILSTSSAPQTRTPKAAEGVKNKSYNDLMQEALDELQLA